MSETLKISFSNIVPISRPVVPFRVIYEPNWLTGFIDGEGCFFINIKKYVYKTNNEKTNKAWLTFQITQHSRDTLFMESLTKYLNCVRIKYKNSSLAVDFIVNKYTDINTKVISFLYRYPMQSVKKMDFKILCKVAKIISNREHLTLKGMDEIKIIKAGMYKGRLSYS